MHFPFRPSPRPLLPRFLATAPPGGTTPGSGDWNTGTNWSPNTVQRSADRVSFGISSVTAISIATDIEVESMGWGSLETRLHVHRHPNHTLTLSGRGIFFNNSGLTQTFVAAADGAGNSASIIFRNSAGADSGTVFNNTGSMIGFPFRRLDSILRHFPTQASAPSTTTAALRMGALGGTAPFL